MYTESNYKTKFSEELKFRELILMFHNTYNISIQRNRSIKSKCRTEYTCTKSLPSNQLSVFNYFLPVV